MSSTQTTIDMEDECVNVVSTTDDDTTGLQVVITSSAQNIMY